MTKAAIRELLAELPEDVWRREVEFTPDLAEAQDRLLCASSDEEAEQILNEWLQRYQPCLFGRIAARSNQLNFCILREADLDKHDSSIRHKIQQKRTEWTRRAFKGERSGFIILAVSPKLATAGPSPALAEFARRLAELYLLDDIAFDKVYLEEVFLEQPGREVTTWRWDAGINYFAANGDKRWWHDHRIPGGIAFSINSVGHMAKSGLMRSALQQLDQVLGVSVSDVGKSKVESLLKSLELAMSTINRATETVSGKATALLPLPADVSKMPARPALPEFLDGKNHCEYFGYYHTDYTLPSEYFDPAVERPQEIAGHALDFTYLFNADIDNPAFVTMGQGRQIRAWDQAEDGQKIPMPTTRLSRAMPTTVAIADIPRLRGIVS